LKNIQIQNDQEFVAMCEETYENHQTS